MSTLTYSDTLTILECCKCGITFAFTVGYERERRQDRARFYCPNGHPQCFVGKTTAERERERADAAERKATRLQARVDQERAAREHEERRARALKGHQTRLKRRLAAGKCPCCSQDFPDLAEHVADAHPGYAGDVA